MLYFNASLSAGFGAALPQGPWDTARAHGKLWVTEDDQRTSFGDQAGLRTGLAPTLWS
jgi:hypothetical protein